ncbi:Exonuclease mut-7-like protein [Drosera capensis]
MNSQRTTETPSVENKLQPTLTLSLHAFSDLSVVPPFVFSYLLKECYVCGTSKATAKFCALQQQVLCALNNCPLPGPSVFILHCLYVLPVFDLHSDGLSHLLLSALRRFLKGKTPLADSLETQDLAAQLFVDVAQGTVLHDDKILVKIIENFRVKLINVEKVMCTLDECSSSKARSFVEKYILKLIESQSYMAAVSLFEQFSIHGSGESFLYKLIEIKEFRAAEKWAAFLGKPMLCVLVQEYMNMNVLGGAYGIIKRNNLQEDFPDICYQYKESSLKKLAEKGCWDVYLAMEAGYYEKVDELCHRYSLEGFVSKEHEASHLKSHYLHLHELFTDDIVWVDEVDGLLNATHYIEGCKVVGLDSEWKPNYVKGSSKPNKVSIMQIASEKTAFIIDLIKLYDDNPEILDSCLTRILHSPRILKLGYNFQCDIRQLSQSYMDLKCFKQYEMLLDIQNMFKEPRGGLSGLAKKILGAGLNKTRRNSDWEQRPLSKNQLEYAALDAVVLIHIFRRVRGDPQATEVKDGSVKMEWKSQIISLMDSTKRTNKLLGRKAQTGEVTQEPLKSR